MMEFIQLANQLMAKFKAAVSPLLVELLPAIVARVFALVPDGGPPEGPGTNTEVRAKCSSRFQVVSSTIRKHDT